MGSCSNDNVGNDGANLGRETERELGSRGNVGEEIREEGRNRVEGERARPERRAEGGRDGAEEVENDRFGGSSVGAIDVGIVR